MAVTFFFVIVSLPASDRGIWNWLNNTLVVYWGFDWDSITIFIHYMHNKIYITVLRYIFFIFVGSQTGTIRHFSASRLLCQYTMQCIAQNCLRLKKYVWKIFCYLYLYNIGYIYTYKYIYIDYYNLFIPLEVRSYSKFDSQRGPRDGLYVCCQF